MARTAAGCHASVPPQQLTREWLLENAAGVEDAA